MARSRTGVTVRESGTIRVTFVFNGERIRRPLLVNGEPMLPTPANLRYATRLAEEIRTKIKLGVFSMHEYFPAAGNVAGGSGTAALLDTWLAAQRIEPSTRAAYESAARFWKAAPCDDRERALGDLPPLAVKHSHVLRALASRPTLTGKTVNNYVSVLREAFALAVLDGTLPRNPVAEVPRAKHQKPPPDPFSRDEAEAIIAHMRARHPEPVANYVETKFFTGVRPGEIAGLRWPSIDFVLGHAQISESIVRGELKPSTKTNHARVIELNSRALAAIKQQKAHTFLVGEHVFLDPRYGTAWTDERAFRRSYWMPTLKSLGIRYRVPYNTRHTYATMMLMAGMEPAYCAGQMGHSVEMFHKVYSKWIDGRHNQAQRARFETFLAEPAKKEATR